MELSPGAINHGEIARWNCLGENEPGKAIAMGTEIA